VVLAFGGGRRAAIRLFFSGPLNVLSFKMAVMASRRSFNDISFTGAGAGSGAGAGAGVGAGAGAGGAGGAFSTLASLLDLERLGERESYDLLREPEYDLLREPEYDPLRDREYDLLREYDPLRERESYDLLRERESYDLLPDRDMDPDLGDLDPLPMEPSCFGGGGLAAGGLSG